MNMIPLLESVYPHFTPVEREVADFFIHNRDYSIDFSSKNIAKQLHVSEPSLTRFAQKCGYSGYRQFIFDYKESSKQKTRISRELTQRVLNDYEELLQKTYQLVNEELLFRVADLLIRSKRVYIYGQGSSGLVAQEMKLRFMRLGLICEAITDDHMMRMNHALIDESTLLIGISVSGQTETILKSLKLAKMNHAHTILLTANNDKSFKEYCDEIILVAIKSTLSQGKIISPQFPLLIMIDIFYAYFLEDNRTEKERIFSSTLAALDLKNEH